MPATGTARYSIKNILLYTFHLFWLSYNNVDDHQDWAWDKTNFLPADISASEFSIQYNNGLVIIIIVVLVFVFIVVLVVVNTTILLPILFMFITTSTIIFMTEKENAFQVESITVPSSASIHEKNAMKAFASVWQIKTGQDAFFQSEEVVFFS